MADEPIDPSVHSLLRERIESYEELEVLLLLGRDGDRSWTSAEVGERLKLGAAAAEALEHLASRGLLEATGAGTARSFVYAPITSDLATAVSRLDVLYGERRLEVARLMNALALERIRTSALRTFADAFLVRRRPSDA